MVKRRGSFSVGCKVEIRRSDAWFTALITKGIYKSSNDFYGVAYMTLDADECSRDPLLESVHCSFVRPRQPPPLKCQNQTFGVHQWVEAFHNKGWWKGVVTKEPEDGNATYALRFPPEREEFRFESDNLRIPMEWVKRKWLKKKLTPPVTLEEIDVVQEYEDEDEEEEDNSVIPSSISPVIPTHVIPSSISPVIPTHVIPTPEEDNSVIPSSDSPVIPTHDNSLLQVLETKYNNLLEKYQERTTEIDKLRGGIELLKKNCAMECEPKYEDLKNKYTQECAERKRLLNEILELKVGDVESRLDRKKAKAQLGSRDSAKYSKPPLAPISKRK